MNARYVGSTGRGEVMEHGWILELEGARGKERCGSLEPELLGYSWDGERFRARLAATLHAAGQVVLLLAAAERQGAWRQRPGNVIGEAHEDDRITVCIFPDPVAQLCWKAKKWGAFCVLRSSFRVLVYEDIC